MTTRKFKGMLIKKGYEYEDTGEVIIVKTIKGNIMLVGKELLYQIHTNWISFLMLPLDEQLALYSLATEYVTTPINKR